MKKSSFLYLLAINNRINLLLPRYRQISLLSSCFISKNPIQINVHRTVIPQQIQTIDQNKQIGSFDMIENLNTQIVLNIKNRNKVFLKDVTNLLAFIESTKLVNSHQALLLITCCTKLLVEVSPKERMALAYRCWEILKTRMSFNVNHYNAILQCYIDNGKEIIASSFLGSMADKPNKKTYKLLLEAVCKLGHMNQAVELIANMQTANIEIDESITNLLIEGYGRLKEMSIVDKMTDDIINKNNLTSNTITTMLKTYLWNDLIDKAFHLLKSYGNSTDITFTEQQVFEILESALQHNRDDLFKEILKLLPQETLSNPIISPFMMSMCSILVYQGHAKVAYMIYKSLPAPKTSETEDENAYMRSFIRDCIKADTPVDAVIKICNDLITSNRNKYALFVACEASLHLYKENTAFKLLNAIKGQNILLRNHYFWPLLIRSYKDSGEKGLLNVLKNMHKMDIIVDEETILDYLLPYISVENPSNYIKKLQTCGVTAAQSILPVLVFLLKQNYLTEASEICKSLNVKINSEKLLTPLVNAYLSVKRSQPLLDILEYIYRHDLKSRVKFMGHFLVQLINKLQDIEDLENLDTIVMKCINSGFRISQFDANICLQRLSRISFDSHLLERINKNIISMIDSNMETTTINTISSNMSSLLGHLSELEANKMNTRGVLRKILLESIRKGDIAQTNATIQKLEDEKVSLSDGMKASIMEFHVKRDSLKNATKYLNQLLESPKFTIDGHKMLDYVTLLAKHGQFDAVINTLNNKSKRCCLLGGDSLIRNCLNLLNTISAHGSVKYTEDVLHLLIKYKYCSMTNVLLGPVVRIFLSRDDVEGAYKIFMNLSEKYKMTPLKHELLLRLLTKSHLPNSEINVEYKIMVDSVLKRNTAIYGEIDSQKSLILALADLNCEELLINALNNSNVKIPKELLMKECRRLASQNKSEALTTLGYAIQKSIKLKNINTMEIFQLTMNVHRSKSDHHSAINLWNSLTKHDIIPTNGILETLLSIYETSNVEIPPEVLKYKNNV